MSSSDSTGLRAEAKSQKPPKAHRSRLSLQDPSNWQPLDAESSFAQWVSMVREPGQSLRNDAPVWLWTAGAAAGAADCRGHRVLQGASGLSVKSLKSLGSELSGQAVNLRYRKWIEDKRQPALQDRLESSRVLQAKDLSEREKCFGWAKYLHEARKKRLRSLSKKKRRWPDRRIHRVAACGHRQRWVFCVWMKSQSGRQRGSQQVQRGEVVVPTALQGR